jgi:hypothetical protein
VAWSVSHKSERCNSRADVCLGPTAAQKRTLRKVREGPLADATAGVCQRLCDLAGVLDEQLRYRNERAVLQGDDTDSASSGEAMADGLNGERLRMRTTET